MALLLLIAALLVVALGLAQVWTLWYLKREVRRLEFRLGESLDDEDLLEFQERLKALLSEAKGASEALVSTAEACRNGLERSLERASQTEKRLALRIVAGAAADAAKGVKRSATVAAKKVSEMRPLPEIKAPPPAATRPGKAAEISSVSGTKKTTIPARPQKRAEAGPDAETGVQDDRRSYLVRPQSSSQPRHQGVYDLADQGLDLEQIAKQSGLLAGEVDLILSLRPNRPTS